MSKEDIAGALGAILSWIATTASFLWNMGALQLVFSFLAGAFTTYIVQHRLQIASEKRRIKRENAIQMRDTIYGPIFEELSIILEHVETVGPLGWEAEDNLKNVMTHFLFFTIERKLKNKLEELLDMLEKYQNIRRATELKLQNVIKTEIEKACQVDIGTVESTPNISLKVEKIHVAWISLIGIILQGITPQDFIRKEKEKWGENVAIEISMGANKRSMNDFEMVYDLVLREIENEYIYLEERAQKSRIIKELQSYLEKVRVFVDLN